jgi:beta-1,4-mannosyltransferase
MHLSTIAANRAKRAQGIIVMRGLEELRVIARPAFRDSDKTPYNFLLYSALAGLGADVFEYKTRSLLLNRHDIWHLHWPESLIEVRNFSAAWISARKQRALMEIVRRRGIKIIWTIHDLIPHDFVFPEIEQPFWNDVIRRVDGVIALTYGGLTLARDCYPCLREVPSFIIPHGHFRDAYPRTMSREEARRILGIAPSQVVATYFGQIRPYKNVPRLVRAFRELQDADAVLMVCGRPSKRMEVTSEILEAAAGDPRVRLTLRYIEPNEIQLYLAAADLLVFAYSEILNSGSAILGLSFDRPILVPDLGAMPELRQSVGPEWVRLYHGGIDARSLREALVWARTTPRGPMAPLKQFDWQRIGEQTLDAYRTVLRKTGPLALRAA